MRDLHKAIAVVVACCFALSGILVAAVLKQSPRLTSQEILGATRVAVDQAVDDAISLGGLKDAEGYLNERIASILSSRYHVNAEVHVVRLNDFDRLSAFYFDVAAKDISVRFHLDGVKDPLLAIRLRLDWRWQEDPHHPYETHGGSSTMSDCLTHHYFHLAADGPDFFARLENRTEDPYHYGVETFIVIDGQAAIDHLYLGGHGDIDDSHRMVYGLE